MLVRVKFVDGGEGGVWVHGGAARTVRLRCYPSALNETKQRLVVFKDT